jgi:xanthine dehydrogenase accessory factor
VGHLGNVPVRAPFDGILRGVVRDGTEVSAGIKLLEIDPRRRKANWTEADNRTRLVADAVKEAILPHQANFPEGTMSSSLHLVK